MSQLLDLSPEILHNIFYHVHPTDLSRLSRSCRHLHQFINNDDFLWRLQFLSRFVSQVTNPAPVFIFLTLALTTTHAFTFSSPTSINWVHPTELYMTNTLHHP